MPPVARAWPGSRQMASDHGLMWEGTELRSGGKSLVFHSSGWEAVTCVGNNLLGNHSNTHLAALDWTPTRHLLSSLVSCGLQKNNTKLIRC